MNVNKSFDKALKKVLSIRENRRKVYGDGWKNSPIAYDIWMLYGKLSRTIYIMNSSNIDKEKYEKFEDTLVDFVIYSLFALQKFIYNKNKKNIKKILFGIEE